MSEDLQIWVLCGGTSAEREVSLRSGAAIAEALAARHRVQMCPLEGDALPDGLDPLRTLVFPALHGGFGENGGLQALLESAGVEYSGSDAQASRLCMDKVATKEVARRMGIATPEWWAFRGEAAPLADAVIERLGSSLVIKPADEGSSVGLHFAEHRSALGVALSQIHSGNWLIEQRITGRELTIGVLGGRALGIVEVISSSGVYDYRAKYTPGSSEYRYPAELAAPVTAAIERAAEVLFEACGCRDFARIDFLLDNEGPKFLEINTLPGLTATSLLPKSASCRGYDFRALADALVGPAIARLNQRTGRGAP